MGFNDLNPHRFMVAGDTHGDMQHVQKLLKWARQPRHDVDVILQVGDFGFVWQNSKKGRKLPDGSRERVYTGYPKGKTQLDKLSRMLVEQDVTMLFLDGNHEDFDRLAALGAYPEGKHPVEIAPNIIYLPRGFRWNWRGVSFMAHGGAFSVDRDSRTFGVEWWNQELITQNDIFRLEESVDRYGGVDVLFTHDAAHPMPGKLESHLLKKARRIKWEWKLDRTSESQRIAVSSILEMTRPKVHIHGHMHHFYTDKWFNEADGTYVHVQGLGRNEQGFESFVVLDTNTIKEMEQP